MTINIIISSIIAVIILVSLILYFSKTDTKECFTVENFDKVLDYTKWKQRTSKIGKVLVNGYRVEVTTEDEIIFKNDKENYTLFKVTRNKGIVLLPVKQNSSLIRKANNAFCELLERALFHPVNP